MKGKLGVVVEQVNTLPVVSLLLHNPSSLLCDCTTVVAMSFGSNAHPSNTLQTSGTNQ